MFFSHKLKFKGGKIKLFDIKAALLPISTVSKLIEELYDHLGDKASEILFEIGKSQGEKAINEVARSNNAGKREFVDKMVDLANIMGLGEWDVENFDINKEIIFCIKDSPLTKELQKLESLKDRDEPIEEFTHGVAHGLGSNILDGEVSSEILKSQFLNDKKTVIRIYKSGN